MDDDLVLDAVERGDLSRARSLLEAAADPDHDAWGLPLLEEALSRHDESMVRLLVKFGARLDEQDERGQTRLHHAAFASDSPEPVSLLLRVGLDPNAADDDGWTPLHFAASCGYRRVAAELVAAGADLSARTAAGQQPADLARVNGHDWQQAPPGRSAT